MVCMNSLSDFQPAYPTEVVTTRGYIGPAYLGQKGGRLDSELEKDDQIRMQFWSQIFGIKRLNSIAYTP